MDKELSKLPRLGEDSMSPCACCHRQLLETELPIFYRFEGKQCGIDGEVVKKHIGLAMQMGGGADGLHLASIMGPGTKPVVVMHTGTSFNICQRCMGAADLLPLLNAVLVDE